MPPHPFAVLAAIIASYIAGSLWYLALGKRWQTAVDLYSATAPYRPRPAELGVALLGQIILAAALSTLIAMVHIATLAGGLATGAAAWLGFILPTLATNVLFQRRPSALIAMDGGHWLLILAIQGAVLGALA